MILHLVRRVVPMASFKGSFTVLDVGWTLGETGLGRMQDVRTRKLDVRGTDPVGAMVHPRRFDMVIRRVAPYNEVEAPRGCAAVATTPG